MKKLLSLLLVLVLIVSIFIYPKKTRAAFGFVQECHSTVVQSGSTATVTCNGVAAGNLLVLEVRSSSENRVVTGVAGNSNTFTQLASAEQIMSGNRINIFYAQNATSGNTTATVTFDTSSAATVWLSMQEYSGIATVGALDKQTSGMVTSGTSISSGSVTTTSANELMVAYCFSANAGRPLDTTPSGFTQRIKLSGTSNEYEESDQRQTVAGAQAVTCAATGGNSNIYAGLVTFVEAASAATVRPPVVSLQQGKLVLLNGLLKF